MYNDKTDVVESEKNNQGQPLTGWMHEMIKRQVAVINSGLSDYGLDTTTVRLNHDEGEFYLEDTGETPKRFHFSSSALCEIVRWINEEWMCDNEPVVDFHYALQCGNAGAVWFSFGYRPTRDQAPADLVADEVACEKRMLFFHQFAHIRSFAETHGYDVKTPDDEQLRLWMQHTLETEEEAIGLIGEVLYNRDFTVLHNFFDKGADVVDCEASCLSDAVDTLNHKLEEVNGADADQLPETPPEGLGDKWMVV